MLYRIFGKAGSGKRERVLGEVKRAFLQGKRVFVIVPEQGTALYEREVTRRCGNRASLSVEVCNFSRLPDLVLREAGSLCHRSITEEEKKLCLFRVLRAHPDLAATLSVKSTPDGVESLFRELEELRAAGLTEENASLQGADLPKSLSDKIALFSLLRSKMRREIALHFGEEADAEEKLASVLDSYPYFRDAVVAVDSFYDFTAPQEAILRRILRQAETVLVTFPAVKKETELFSVPLLAARRLLRFASEEGVSVEDITLTPPPSFSPLAFLKWIPASPSPPAETPRRRRCFWPLPSVRRWKRARFGAPLPFCPARRKIFRSSPSP